MNLTLSYIQEKRSQSKTVVENQEEQDDEACDVEENIFEER